MNPNHYLAVAISYLLTHRSGWKADSAVGKTLVSSSLIDRVVAGLGRRLCEVPVGFKWFVPGLLDGSMGFGGEESAGASFLRRGLLTIAIGTGGVGVTLLGAVADRYGVPAATHLINGLPALGALLALLLPLIILVGVVLLIVVGVATIGLLGVFQALIEPR